MVNRLLSAAVVLSEQQQSLLVKWMIPVMNFVSCDHCYHQIAVENICGE
jgi:hypothetical protein